MDEVTKKWFDPSTVKVVRSPELEGWHQDEDLARLSGAPRDSEVHVATTRAGVIELRVLNQDLLSEPLVRSVARTVEGGYVFMIQNRAFVLRPAFRGMGIGPRSVAIELHEAQRLGYFSKVVVHAVGDWHHRAGESAMNGYYVWAKMGFNAALPICYREHPELPAICRNCRDVVELFATTEGEAFWLRHGSTIKLSFPLEESSASWHHYRRYARERGIEVTA
jgi:GNAT superfamily N-acetyltransferase